MGGFFQKIRDGVRRLPVMFHFAGGSCRDQPEPGPVGRQVLAGVERWIVLSSLSKYC